MESVKTESNALSSQFFLSFPDNVIQLEHHFLHSGKEKKAEINQILMQLDSQHSN